MSCSRTSKDLATNRVFPRIESKLSGELLRNVLVRPPISRCEDPRMLNKNEVDHDLTAYRNLETEKYRFNVPMNERQTPHFISSPKCKEERKSNRLSLDEVDLIIRDEIGRKRHTIEQIFEKHTASAGLSVSRGTLLKICKTLCPLISIELFHRLLERYELDRTPLVSFRQFEEAFTAPPLGRHLPPNIFRGLGAERCLSVAEAYRMLREIACDGEFDLKTVLPTSCFESGGRVLCPQFREALDILRVHLTDENYRRLWRDKFDLGRFGSIRTSDLCKVLNLRDDGTPLGIKVDVKPLNTAHMRGLPKFNKNPQLWIPPERPPFVMLPPYAEGSADGGYKLVRELPVAGGTGFPLAEQHTWVPEGPGGAVEPPFGCGDRFKQRLVELGKHYPRFDDVMDCLKYKFETPYQAMIVAFRRLDPKNESRVSENQCLNVLREYGLSISPENLHIFLSRILSSSEATGYGLGRDMAPSAQGPGEDEVSIRPGMIPYKRMLKFYQNRRKGGPAHRILSEMASRTSCNMGAGRLNYLTPDEIEEELVKLLHRNFIEFTHQLKTNCEYPHGVRQEVFRDAINRVIGFHMSDTQWQALQKHLTHSLPGVINFEQFLDNFNAPSNVAPYRTTDVFDATKWHCPPKGDPYRGDVRQKPVLLKLVEKTLRSRLHFIDKTYKHYDHKEMNMLSKEDFGELLNTQGLHITLAELDFLWGLLDDIEPCKELHNYRQVMNFFYNRTRPLIAAMIRAKRHSRTRTLHDPNVEHLREWRQTFQQYKKDSEAGLLEAGRVAPTIPPRAPCSAKPSEERINDLCTKIAHQVMKDWDHLQRSFIDGDNSGSRKILWNKFQEIAKIYHLPLSDIELSELFSGFSSKEKDYFNYVKFMAHFARTLPKEKASLTSFDERLCQFTNKKTGQKLAFADVLKEIRKACTRNWRTLQEAFRKLDTKHRGVLTIDQLEEILRARGIVLSADDLYHLFTGFDVNMNGFVNFDAFKQTIMRTHKPVAQSQG